MFQWPSEKVDSVFTVLFPIGFAAVFVFLLVQAFRMMTLGFNMKGASSPTQRQDRTGLLTTHPELLDQNGDITSEDLLVVKFQEMGDSEIAPA
jgi:hypothetical protein